MQELSAKGIGTQVLYIPVYLQPWYRSQFGYSVGKCPNSEKFYHSALSIPLHPALTDSDIETVVCAIKQCL